MTSKQITLGAGCFWCVEACFRNVKGVLKAVSGYSGGDKTRITYKEVYTGTTGHAEVVQILGPNFLTCLLNMFILRFTIQLFLIVKMTRI